jgi:hypothetical protein
MTAIVSNGFIAATKIAGFLYTGSGSMFSEAVHSLADTANQVSAVFLSPNKKEKNFLFFSSSLFFSFFFFLFFFSTFFSFFDSRGYFGENKQSGAALLRHSSFSETTNSRTPLWTWTGTICLVADIRIGHLLRWQWRFDLPRHHNAPQSPSPRVHPRCWYLNFQKQTNERTNELRKILFYFICFCWWTAVVLGISLIVEGASFAVALYECQRGAKAVGMPLIEYVVKGVDVTNTAVLLEDIVAISGVGIASLCIALTLHTGQVWWDSLGAISVGGLLSAVALLLVQKNKEALIGATISADQNFRITNTLATGLLFCVFVRLFVCCGELI